MAEMNGRINSNDRFVRWQTVLREHLTNMNNLLLTIAIGVVGFLVSLMKEPDFKLICCEKLFFSAGLIFLFLSVLTGIVTGLCRLIDFRGTVKTIKTEQIGESMSEIEDLKRMTKLYGKHTWGWFYAQIISFGLGMILLFIAFSMIFEEKLF